MSEITRGVIGMPFEMAMENNLSRRQFHSIAQGLLIERDQLKAENNSVRKHWQNESNNVQALMAEILRLKAENEQLKIDNGSLRGSTKRMGEEFSKMQKQLRKAGRDIDKLKKENDRLECLLEIKKIDAKTYREASERFQAENEALRKELSQCAESLHGEMLQKFGGQLPEDMHPVTRRDYDRDMAEVSGYRAALSKGEQP